MKRALKNARQGMDQLLEISEVIKHTLSENFQTTKIVGVRTFATENAEGEGLLQIYVVIDGTPKDVDAHELSGAVRLVRPKLDEIDEQRFPIFSFVSKKEIGDRPIGPR
jgi:hypothetical protein